MSKKVKLEKFFAAFGLLVLIAIVLVSSWWAIEVVLGNRDMPWVRIKTPAAVVNEDYLVEEEAVIIESKEVGEEPVILPIEKVLFEYVKVVDGCGIHFGGECLNVRSEPSTSSPAVAQLRNGIVLKVGGKVTNDGMDWYKIVFDEWLRYPERLNGDWYVAADYVEVLKDEGDKTIWEDGHASTSKRIVVDRSDQTLQAYDGEELFAEMSISTGLDLSPTPRGNFTIFKKTPSRYMQGPLPGIVGSDYYDLPGVPWNLYFTEQGAVIHGAYWHDSFGTPYSHGCVNLSPTEAQKLYEWADLGTKVLVRD